MDRFLSGVFLWLLSIAIAHAQTVPRKPSVAPSTSCSESFARLITPIAPGDSKAAHVSRLYLRAEVERSHRASVSRWFRESLEKDLDQALLERGHFQRYLDEGLAPGEEVYWIQQRQLKDLNEKLWDIGGTEYYLMTLDRQLGDLFKRHPEYGRVIHRNYKDRVVVSSLSPEDFEKKVLEPLKAGVAADIGLIKDRLSTSYLWQDYMRDSIKVARGDSLENAFLRLNLGPQGKSFDEWKRSTTLLRASLVERLHAVYPDESIEKFLRMARKRRDDLPQLEHWLARQGLPKSLGADLIRYLEELRLADFLPVAKPLSEADRSVLKHAQESLKNDPSGSLNVLPRIEAIIDDSWIFQRTRFLKQSQNARYMVATDIRGLGERGMLAQDHWLQQGADPAKLPRIYEGTTAFLNGRYDDILARLKAVIGPHETVAVYRSGDDALWSLPDMTLDQKQAVEAIFREQNDLYYALVDINTKAGPEGLAEAVHGARDKLFSDKATLKGREEP